MIVGTTEKTKITFSDDFGHGHFILLICVNNEHCKIVHPINTGFLYSQSRLSVQYIPKYNDINFSSILFSYMVCHYQTQLNKQ